MKWFSGSHYLKTQIVNIDRRHLFNCIWLGAKQQER